MKTVFTVKLKFTPNQALKFNYNKFKDEVQEALEKDMDDPWWWEMIFTDYENKELVDDYVNFIFSLPMEDIMNHVEIKEDTLTCIEYLDYELLYVVDVVWDCDGWLEKEFGRPLS